MAREVGEKPATVHWWKTKGRIPAEKQPHVLEVAVSLGLPITSENLVFPLGRPSDVANTITATPAPVACSTQGVVQRTGAVR